MAVEVPRAADDLRVQATSVTAGDELTTTARPLDEGSQDVALSLPDADRLLSITFQADTGTDLPDELEISIGSPQLGDQALDLATWQPTTWRGSTGTLESDPAGSLR